MCFGWFVPFFFVGTGVKFQLHAITHDLTTALLVPLFLLAILVVRGGPVWLYRKNLARAERLPFALYCGVASLSLVVVITDIGVHTGSIDGKVAAALVGATVLLVVVITDIGVRTGSIDAKVAAALVGAAVLSVLLFPTVAAAPLRREAVIAGNDVTRASG